MIIAMEAYSLFVPFLVPLCEEVLSVSLFAHFQSSPVIAWPLFCHCLSVNEVFSRSLES